MSIKFNLFIDQGASYELEYDMLDEAGNQLDLSGYVGRAAMKPWYTYGNTINFNVTLTTGKMILSMDANTTAAIDFGRYVYDAEIENVSTGIITRVVQGLVNVQPEVK